jgi:7,8-dihydroneopterin aldolase/epimerase/oxygenase
VTEPAGRDRIVLSNMVFEGRHGVLPIERTQAQPFEVDVELHLNLLPAGNSDDLTQSVDYRDVFELCRGIVEGRSYQLLEALAEAIAADALARFEVEEVVVRVRKPKVALPGKLDYAGVEIRRRA